MVLSAVTLLSTSAAALSEADVRYLFGRVAFGASAADVVRFEKKSWEQAVQTLLSEVRTEPFQAPPDWVFDQPFLPRVSKSALSKDQKKVARKARRRDRKEAGKALKAWWLTEMAVTPAPTSERMTLFWHNHFTSSLKKVRLPALMYRQNQLFRQQALGNFRELLHEVLRDPAMLLYLDNQQNKAAHPNENLARELLELFTLGEGNYQERDVLAAARALTGRRVRRGTGEVREQVRHHDDGVKTFLGQVGVFDGDALVDIILEQPACAEFLSAKLWRTFVSDLPDAVAIQHLARVLREHDYDILPWVRAMLLNSSFRGMSNRGRLIKSPVEVSVGTLRILSLKIDGAVLSKVVGRLGQDVFDPPSVLGWPGGRRWISAASLLARRQLMLRMAEEFQLRGQSLRSDPVGLLVVDPVRELPPSGAGRLRAVLLDPSWQVK